MLKKLEAAQFERTSFAMMLMLQQLSRLAPVASYQHIGRPIPGVSRKRKNLALVPVAVTYEDHILPTGKTKSVKVTHMTYVSTREWPKPKS